MNGTIKLTGFEEIKIRGIFDLLFFLESFKSLEIKDRIHWTIIAQNKNFLKYCVKDKSSLALVLNKLNDFNGFLLINLLQDDIGSTIQSVKDLDFILFQLKKEEHKTFLLKSLSTTSFFERSITTIDEIVLILDKFNEIKNKRLAVKFIGKDLFVIKGTDVKGYFNLFRTIGKDLVKEIILYIGYERLSYLIVTLDQLNRFSKIVYDEQFTELINKMKPEVKLDFLQQALELELNNKKLLNALGI